MAERAKIREYGQRIKESEHADFNPLVSPAQVEWLLKVTCTEEVSRETESEAKYSAVCCFWLAAMQAELCAVADDAVMRASNSSQENSL